MLRFWKEATEWHGVNVSVAVHFFNDTLKNMPANTELTKRKFCKGDYSRCARYMVIKALGEGKVPNYLFPQSVDEARRIIEGG